MGFIIGIVCLWGLIRVVRGGGWGRRFGGGCGSGWRRAGGHGPSWRDHHGDDHGGGWWRGRRSRRGRMRWLFERLETSPGQEREIHGAVDEVTRAAHDFKDKLSATRHDLAEAFRRDDIDADTMASLLTKHDGDLDELRGAFVASLAKVHATLDPDQRRIVARWLEKNRRWGGPYRSAWEV